MTASPRKSKQTAATDPAAAHNIWLAGLGALASAQAEGSKAFEALVQQGLEMQSRTQTLTRERMAEAAQRMEDMTRQAAGAVPAWNRLGEIFEDRVARALAGLGMPTAQELAALSARVDALERALGQPRPKAHPKAARAAAGKPAARATPRKQG